ncbi:hypothetical protein LWI28_008118 [Acer negundo]|uniref:RNase H type-1 domain-containing protein n=1 Tax=Acer negundo TaxID=4023 RepID=A0AAD5NWR6_ACENE|nr:hypothetical protein LWI28_008118 [Acer negundo]
MRWKEDKILDRVGWEGKVSYDIFPKNLCLGFKKDGLVSEFGEWHGQVWCWKVLLRKRLFNYEVDQWKDFIGRLEEFKLRPFFSYTRAWSYCSNGSFSVGSFCRCLENETQDWLEKYSFILQGVCLYKIEMFRWQLLIGGNHGERDGLIRFGEVAWRGGMFLAMQIRLWWSGLMVGQVCVRILTKKEHGIPFSLQLCGLFGNREIRLCSRIKSWGLVKRWIWLGSGWLCGSSTLGKEPLILFLLCCWISVPAALLQTLQKLPGRMFGPSPLSRDVLKFNVDGSVKGNPGYAGICGVMRDHSGKVVGSFSKHIGFADANSAEIAAIHQACVLCAGSPNLVGKKVIIISDSMTAISWVNGSNLGSLKHVNLIYDIKSLLHFLGRTVVGFNSRSTNNLMDCLAQRASNREGDFVI